MLFKRFLSSLILLSAAAAVHAQSYNEYDFGNWSWRAYEPVLVGSNVVGTGTSYTSNMTGENWCAQLYMDGLIRGTNVCTSSYAMIHDNPDSVMPSTPCPHGYTYQWYLFVQPSGFPNPGVKSPIATIACP